MKSPNQQPASSASDVMPCSASSFQWVCWIFGWLIRLNYDREGWWITDAQGYRNTLSLAYTVITDTTGQKARRITAWRVMFEWAYPLNS
jgi:hypothetical protein